MSETRIFKETAFSDIGLSDLVPLSFGASRCDGGHAAYGMRNYYVIHYVRRGRGILTLGKEKYNVGKGEVFIIKKHADAVYRADVNDPWEYVWICFDGRLASRLDGAPPVLPMPSAPFDMLAELALRGDTKEEVAASVLYLIMAEIFKGKTVLPGYTERAIDIIQNLYMNKITVADIADDLGLDRRYLSRIFHAETGFGIKEYLTRVRLEAAKKHLRSGRGVALTAELSGYADSFNFSKAFKKYTGLSPREFAKAD